MNQKSAKSSEDLAAQLKAAADPLRLQILRVLRDNAYGVLELSDIFDLRQSGMSHHLKLLAQNEWLDKRREGNSIFYRRGLAPLNSLQAKVFELADRLELNEKLQSGLDKVQQERISASTEFFNKHSTHFKEQQDLIAEFDAYGETANALLKNNLPKQQKMALEVGPGAGEFLANLSQNFDQVCAVDISADMLEQAKSFCSTQDLKNVSLKVGTIAESGLNEETVSAITYNMVLHHVPTPADEFSASAKLLQPGGRLLITDLCQHDQTWARENCGDLWLGFEETELRSWAIQAGLKPLQTAYVGLRNGFQIQCQLFGKESV